MGEVFKTFWLDFVSFLPDLLFALLIFIVGWFIALATGKVISGLLYKLKFNDFFQGKEWDDAMKKADIRINPSQFIGNVVKWVAFIFVIDFTVQRLGIDEFTVFMGRVVAYLPNLIVALLIFVVAVMIGEFLSKMAVLTAEKSEFPYSKTIGAIVRFAIWIYAGFAILVQLQIVEELNVILFQGIVAFLVIAGGLSFGLGGQDAAKQVINRIKKMLK